MYGLIYHHFNDQTVREFGGRADTRLVFRSFLGRCSARAAFRQLCRRGSENMAPCFVRGGLEYDSWSQYGAPNSSSLASVIDCTTNNVYLDSPVLILYPHRWLRSTPSVGNGTREARVAGLFLMRLLLSVNKSRPTSVARQGRSSCCQSMELLSLLLVTGHTCVT